MDDLTESAAAPSAAGGLREARAEFELQYFSGLLKKNKWKVRLVAIEAGMERTACYRKLYVLGLLNSSEPPKARPKLQIVPRIVAPKMPLPPTELVERSPRNNGICRLIRAKLMEIEPGTKQSFEVEAGITTAHQAASALGIKISTERRAGKVIRIWRLT